MLILFTDEIVQLAPLGMSCLKVIKLTTSNYLVSWPLNFLKAPALQTVVAHWTTVIPPKSLELMFRALDRRIARLHPSFPYPSELRTLHIFFPSGIHSSQRPDSTWFREVFEIASKSKQAVKISVHYDKYNRTEYD